VPEDDPPPPPGRLSLHLRVPPELHAAVTDYAERTFRSVNGAGAYLLRRGLDAEEGES
jgi:hypothetical protein